MRGRGVDEVRGGSVLGQREGARAEGEQVHQLQRVAAALHQLALLLRVWVWVRIRVRVRVRARVRVRVRVMVRVRVEVKVRVRVRVTPPPVRAARGCGKNAALELPFRFP